jgi:predicted nucleic acid-binding protein
MRIVLDTGPLVALLNRRDAFHGWSVEHAGRLLPPFFTCEAVLAEAHFLLAGVHQGNSRLIDLTASGRLDLTFSFAPQHDRVGALMRTYATIPMSFADACLVCMAEQEKSIVFTLDSDFRIYRKHRKEPLDLLMP